jgi:hypothetical protein
MKTSMTKSDTFLADAVKPKPTPKHITYMDGFRFGFGFFVSGLLIALVLAGLAWAFIVVLKLH